MHCFTKLKFRDFCHISKSIAVTITITQYLLVKYSLGLGNKVHQVLKQNPRKMIGCFKLHNQVAAFYYTLES